jgi:hypothetical protein
MKTTPLHGWAIAGAIGIAFVTALPSSAQNRRNTPTREDTRTIDRNASSEGSAEPIKYDEIPGRVRDKINDTKKDDKVVNAYRIRANGHDNYRVVTQRKNRDRVILADDTGRILNVEDVRDAELASFRQDPDTWLRDYDNRNFGRQREYARAAESIRGTPEHPEQINLDQVPGPARAALIREASGDRARLANTIRYKDNQGNVIYQCNIPDEPGNPKSVHMVQVLSDGRIFNEADFNNRGQKLEDWQPRTLGYEDLPNRVKDTVDREAPRGRVPHIDVARRGGREIYTVEIDERDSTRYLTIAEDGHVLSDTSERYNSNAR